MAPSPVLPRLFSIKGCGQLHTEFQKYEFSKGDYLLVSNEGVLSVREKEYDFITHARLEKEYDYHCKIMNIPFFTNFKKWKPFYIWRSKVRGKKIHMAKEALERHLFIVNQVYKLKCEVCLFPCDLIMS